MESYQVWDVTTPSIPPRSRLYRLEPIGVGTSSVECLASYIARLAEAHCVTLKALMMHEIFPSQGLDFTEPHHYRHLSTFCEQNSSSLNGCSSMARHWVEVMQSLTSCDNLRFLTMSSPLRSFALGAAKCPDVSTPSTTARYRVPALSGDNALLVASRPRGLLYTLRWLVGRRISRRGSRKHVD